MRNEQRTGVRICEALSDNEILACYSVLWQLRPHLNKDNFVETIHHLRTTTGLKLVYLAEGEDVKCVAGYRISEWLAGGKYLEIEDLVSAQDQRSKGYGGEVFDWLMKIAEGSNCRQLRLVSNVRRTDAHRFYEKKGMKKEAYYFSIDTTPAQQ